MEQKNFNNENTTNTLECVKLNFNSTLVHEVNREECVLSGEDFEENIAEDFEFAVTRSSTPHHGQQSEKFPSVSFLFDSIYSKLNIE